MNPDDDDLDYLTRIDQICERFELAWKSDHTPSIEDFLLAIDAPHRARLFSHLFAIERDYRRGAGTQIPIEEYYQRFPEFYAQITSATDTAEITQPTSIPRDPTLPLKQIGPYELVGRLGEGGFGTVYKAIQTAPLRRTVAVKVLRPDMDSEVVLQRFEAERQALALMDHPNIAQALDAGTTDDGRSYFVMEYVDGCSITEYCDTQHLDAHERLALFVDVCRGVQHAHMKGIIHRDLKPSNILVTRQDDKAIAKIIDFGVAKATAGKLTDLTIVTLEGLMIGTPAFMSPEQAEGSLDVDSRADVFSLGAVLYEMLTGSQPLDKKVLLRDGPAGIPAAIRDIDPPRPSVRMDHHGADSHAARRSTDTTSLRRIIAGDLDWITLKALEKERSRRYQTASDLAADIDRYLNDEEVQAAPPNTFYRLRKLVRRRKKTVFAVGVISSAVILASIGAGIGWWKSNQANKELGLAVQAKDLALSEKDEALRNETEQRTLAEESEDRALLAEAAARARADELERVTQFETGRLRDLDPKRMGTKLRETLIDAAPAEQQAELKESLAAVNFTDIALQSLRDNLFDRTLEAIDERFADQPGVQARLLISMSDTLTKLGLLDSASEPQERALAILRVQHGDDHPETLNAICNLGARLCQQGRINEAEPYLQEGLEGLRKLHGDKHPKTLNAIGNLGTLLAARGRYGAAETFCREALAGQRETLGNDDPQTLLGINSLAGLLANQGKLAEAEQFFREALEGQRQTLGDDHAHTLVTSGALGALLIKHGQPGEGEELCRAALEGQRRTLGNDHPHTLVTVSAIGEFLSNTNRLDEADAYNREALEGRQRVLGNRHPETLISIANLGTQLYRQGKAAEAWPYYEKALSIRRRVLGDDHPATLDSINGIASLLADQGKLAEARTHYLEALEGRRKALGPDHPKTLASTTNLGVLFFREGNLEEAERLVREGLEGRRRVLGDDHPQTLASVINLGNLLSAQGKLDEAQPFVSETVAARRRMLGNDHPDTLAAINDLASLSLRQEDYGAAEALFIEAIEGRRRELGHDHPQTLATIRRLGVLRAREDRMEDAVSLFREAFDAQRRTLGDTHVDTVRSSNSLKNALAKIVTDARKKDDTQKITTSLTDLGSHLVIRAEHDEAESVLVECAERWLAATDDTVDPSRVTQAIERVIAFYEQRHQTDPSQGFDEKADPWRERLPQ